MTKAATVPVFMIRHLQKRGNREQRIWEQRIWEQRIWEQRIWEQRIWEQGTADLGTADLGTADLGEIIDNLWTRIDFNNLIPSQECAFPLLVSIPSQECAFPLLVSIPSQECAFRKQAVGGAGPHRLRLSATRGLTACDLPLAEEFPLTEELR
nr:hypothetical protein [Okeania sp. SIO3I5]